MIYLASLPLHRLCHHTIEDYCDPLTPGSLVTPELPREMRLVPRVAPPVVLHKACAFCTLRTVEVQTQQPGDSRSLTQTTNVSRGKHHAVLGSQPTY